MKITEIAVPSVQKGKHVVKEKNTSLEVSLHETTTWNENVSWRVVKNKNILIKVKAIEQPIVKDSSKLDMIIVLFLIV